jgi:hypothetical protein
MPNHRVHRQAGHRERLIVGLLRFVGVADLEAGLQRAGA